jgi:hypothetical protein
MAATPSPASVPYLDQQNALVATELAVGWPSFVSMFEWTPCTTQGYFERTTEEIRPAERGSDIANFQTPAQLRRGLRQAGISSEAITAAWPAWWSEEAIGSPSAEAELRFTLARRLGLSPTSLVTEEQATFVWQDSAKFKRLAATDRDAAVLTSFGRSTAASLGDAVAGPGRLDLPLASELRAAIMRQWGVVDLRGLLGVLWAFGVPAVYLRVFPLSAKRMDAMSVLTHERAVILLARDTKYPASLAFTVAHEMGHIARGHAAHQAVIDIGDPVESPDREDAEEEEANAYAKELLAGHPDFQPLPTHAEFNGDQLAEAAIRLGSELGIDPGVVAMCTAFETGRWRQGYRALNILGAVDEQLIDNVNRLAIGQLDLQSLPDDRAGYLRRLMGVTA